VKVTVTISLANDQQMLLKVKGDPLSKMTEWKRKQVQVLIKKLQAAYKAELS